MFWVVDIFKFVFSLAILGMHCYILGNLKWEQDWLYPLFFHSGVPYFFVASGFFFGKKYFTKGYSSEIFSKFCKRLFQKLIIFEPISQLEVILISALAGTAALTIAFEMVQHILFYPYGGMWYIQSLLIGALLLVPFIKYHKVRWIIPVGLILYSFALISGRYYFLIADCRGLKDFVDGYLYWCVSPQNGLFIGFLYTGLGVIAAKMWDNKTLMFRQFGGGRVNICVALATAIYLVEVYLLRDCQNELGSSFLITQPLFIFFLFLLSAKFYESPSNPKHNTMLIRDMSIGIYLLHPPIQRLFTLIQELTGIHTRLLNNPYSLFALTLFFTLIICYPVYKKKPKYLYSWLS